MFNHSKKIIFINFVVIGLILFLPYYIFGGKLFIGGDDTRLFYVYPFEWIKNIAYFSWFNFSSVGLFSPNQFVIPVLIPLAFAKALIGNDVVTDYFVFSGALIFGFVSFQLLISEIVSLKNNRMRIISVLGALFYILSPILVTIQLSSFLYDVWLIGLLPLVTYFFIKYLRFGNVKYIFFTVITCLVFSIAMFSIPWILGYVLSVLAGLIVSVFLYLRKDIVFFFKKSVVFFGILVVSQSFWLLSFGQSLLASDKNSFGSQVLSESAVDSFTNTVLSTATGDVVFPLLNLFHRKIAFDYNWDLKNVFLGFYDKIFLLDIFLPIILFFGFTLSKKILNNSEKKTFIVFLIAFLSSLFFFTVNIGFLKNVFLAFGHIPGFTMFDNFYAKFDLAYILFYSIVLTASLLIINRKIKNKIVLVLINSFFLFLIILNALPMKSLISPVIWTTKNIYSNIAIPREYTDFMDQVRNEVGSTSNILSLPFNIASYTTIKDESSNNVFSGRSPVQLFTGVNDFSGNLSFSQPDTDRLIGDIISRNYEDLNIFLLEHNIGYVFITNNIPQEVLRSYMFDDALTSYQDRLFLEGITDKKIIESKKGNYILYKTKFSTSLVQSKNVVFQKISPVKYKIYIKNLKNLQELAFLDSFSDGWKLFLQPNPNVSGCEVVNIIKTQNISECNQLSKYFNIGDLGYSWKKPIFNDSHGDIYNFANVWTVDSKNVTSDYPSKYYKVNSDGSINIELTLYFQPQNYFYFGTVMSILTVLSLGAYLVFRKKK